MTREELKAHCEKQMEMCEMWAINKNEKPSGKVYEEHKLILELLEQEPRWIPVSERLPNVDDYTGSRVWQKKVLITGYLSFDSTKELFVSEAFVNDIINNREHDTIIKAWMPLPKPYRENENGNDD